MKLSLIPTSIPDILILKPNVFGDQRGYFYESFNSLDFQAATGLSVQFVQDNHSLSKKGILRGLHFQTQHTQGKLVRVIKGKVFDVAVDLRKASPSFGKWVAQELSEENYLQMWIPAGFAHGFLVLSESAEFLYKTTDYYDPSSEICLLWNDPTVGIQWPLNGLGVDTPLLNTKDQAGLSWQAIPKF
ncbi:MAG: dTDP-4-dehydrorhamnose 3,5-epimerase [Polynucleobacter sp.]|nr:dTDP-4-dehydrorhamnose 3,5-epimerase [Polynucleobacter sp.]